MEQDGHILTNLSGSRHYRRGPLRLLPSANAIKFLKQSYHLSFCQMWCGPKRKHLLFFSHLLLLSIQDVPKQHLGVTTARAAARVVPVLWSAGPVVAETVLELQEAKVASLHLPHPYGPTKNDEFHWRSFEERRPSIGVH